MDIRSFTDLAGTRSVAHFSDDGLYRYYLARAWGQDWRNILCGVFMNPSTADERRNDNTLAGWQRRAIALGYDGFSILNAYALRSTNPKGLLAVSDPVGPLNDAYINEKIKHVRTVVCGWGKPPKYVQWRLRSVLELLQGAGVGLHVLAINQDGSPKHPLYVKGTAPLLKWKP